MSEMKQATCNSCRWAQPAQKEGDFGECRIRPPHPEHGWPLVRASYWCGEWCWMGEGTERGLWYPPTLAEQEWELKKKERIEKAREAARQLPPLVTTTRKVRVKVKPLSK